MTQMYIEHNRSAEQYQADSKSTRIGIVGLGNIGRPMAEGLIRCGFIAPEQLSLSNRDKASTLEKGVHIQGFDVSLAGIDNATVVRESHYVIVALKQDKMIHELRKWRADNLLTDDKVIISFAAGIRTDTIKRELGNVNQPVARAMPNLGVKFGRGTIGWTASDEVTLGQQKYIHQLLSSVCRSVLYVHTEDLIDTVTAHYGGGPAYYCEVAAGKIEDATIAGINAEDAARSERENVIVTAHLLEAGYSFEEISLMVCSKKGTTLSALSSLASNNHRQILSEAMKAAAARGREIGIEYDNFNNLQI